MSSLYLKLNLSKTELLVFSPSTNLPLPDIAISVCGSTITPKQHARCLGVILDSDLSFTPYIRSLARSSYLHLKNISRIRPFLNFDSAKTLTVSLIHSRLDYCNSLLIGLPLAKLSPLQSVLNAAARIIFLTNRYTDASTLCQSLHWLPIHSRIQYKTTTLIHKALHGSAPPYISSLVSVYHPTRALRSANDLRLVKAQRKESGSPPSKKRVPFAEQLQFILISRNLRRTEGNVRAQTPPVHEGSSPEHGVGEEVEDFPMCSSPNPPFPRPSSSMYAAVMAPSCTVASSSSAVDAALVSSAVAPASGAASNSAVGGSRPTGMGAGSARLVPLVRAAPKKGKKKKTSTSVIEAITSRTLNIIDNSSTQDEMDKYGSVIASRLSKRCCREDMNGASAPDA
ncbi:unnamed protein product, partial [Ranitomeya imitator]